jgi:hypothetical protein
VEQALELKAWFEGGACFVADARDKTFKPTDDRGFEGGVEV